MKAKNSKLFTDISFNYKGIEAIKNIHFTKEFKWNAWNLKLSELKDPNHIYSKLFLTNLFLTTSHNVMFCLGFNPVEEM